MPCTSFCRLGALVGQAEELSDIFHISGVELLQHLLVSHTLAKRKYDSRGRNSGYGVANLREPLRERSQRLSLALFHCQEVSLAARAHVGTLKVRHELFAQIVPSFYRSLR